MNRINHVRKTLVHSVGLTGKLKITPLCAVLIYRSTECQAGAATLVTIRRLCGKIISKILFFQIEKAVCVLRNPYL